jgi:flagellin
MSRIVTNSSANTVYKNYFRNNAALAGSTEKLASGLKINRPSDDPGGLGVSEGMRARIKGTNSAIENLQNALSYTNSADGALQTLSDIAGRMFELAVREGDGSLGTNAANLVTEKTALAAEITSLLAVNYSGGLTTVPSADTTFVSDADGTTLTVLAANTALISALDGTSDTTAISAAIDELNTTRAQLGADQSTLTFHLSSQVAYLDNLSAAEGVVRNVDMAQESTKFSRNQILVQSSTAMLAQANSASQNVLSLLR